MKKKVILVVSSVLTLSPAAMLMSLTPAAISAEDCAPLEAAYERLLGGSFSVERHFRMSINGNLKKREIARLDYDGGELVTEVLEEETLSKGIVLDGEGNDFALESEFSCDRLAASGDGSYELSSEDGLEVVVFDLDAQTGGLRPVSWRLDASERFLFKKFVIEGRVEYRDFEWR